MTLSRCLLTGFVCAGIFLAGCAASRDPGLLKYEAYAAEVEQKAVRGEISDIEAENLKLQAYQAYQETRRREEKRLMDDVVAEHLQSQNQEIQAVANQARSLA